jgi:hypothetical protein
MIHESQAIHELSGLEDMNAAAPHFVAPVVFPTLKG